MYRVVHIWLSFSTSKTHRMNRTRFPTAYHNIKHLNADKPGFTFIHPIVRAFHPWMSGFMASRMYGLGQPHNGIQSKWNVTRNRAGITGKRIV